MTMQAVIFDMDGVLIDSEPVHRRVERDLFVSCGLPVDEREHAGYLGTSSPEMFRAIAARHPADWVRGGFSVDDLVARVDRAYAEELEAGRVPLIAEAVRLLRSAVGAGLAVAIASSAPRSEIDLVVDLAGVDDVVGCRRSSEDVTRGKPAPDIYRSTAVCLGVPPDACWVIEDSPTGVRAAVAAGMRCIGYRNPASGAPDLAEAERSFDRMAQIAAYLLPAGPEIT